MAIENAADALALTNAAIAEFETETVPSFVAEVLHQIEMVAMQDHFNEREYDAAGLRDSFPPESLGPMKDALIAKGFTVTGTVISW